ncbi:MAG: 30S ribosomal protein S12 methylthiotransferase RimO [Muribaculaceae bacterium]|nr:30S ribosomal protein S12 methylthiotransferase RimO [Muribaculaceae bacterium]
MPRRTIDIITMGCSKNLVDSERLIQMLNTAGFEARHDPDTLQADYVVINTCGFIGDAKEESINTILQCCEAKNKGRVGKVFVMGCLSERYRNELPAEIPEVDRWYGKFDWTSLVRDISNDYSVDATYERHITSPGHHAYIKISEGCNRFCAFCAIPLITGRHHSRTIEDIVGEVTSLVQKGVTEFNIIAQDLSSYGLDIYGEKRLAQLVENLAQINGIKRIRLHYAYPSDFPYEVLDVMNKYPNVCKYLDIALQHISDPVLKNMRRHISSAETLSLLQHIRQVVPGIHIRTTLMVGFPGEGEKEFEELLEFVKTQRFERMGAFAYCEEDDTYAAKNFKDEITAETKKNRLDRVMALQESIALEHNQSKVGKVFEVVIDSADEKYFIGRTEFDSPEVDPEVLIERNTTDSELLIGKYYNVRITRAFPFELFGIVENNL